MKKILAVMSLLIVGISTSQAQSLSDLLNTFLGGNSTTEQQVESEKPTYPTARQLMQKWTYVQLEMEYSGNDMMAMALASIEEQFMALGEKIGLTAGEDYIRFRSNGALTLGLDGNEIPASYTYIPPTGNLILTIDNGKEKLLVTAKVTIEEEESLKVMFNAKELLTIANEYIPSLKENTMFASSASMIISSSERYLSKYPQHEKQQGAIFLTIAPCFIIRPTPLYNHSSQTRTRYRYPPGQ